MPQLISGEWQAGWTCQEPEIFGRQQRFRVFGSFFCQKPVSLTGSAGAPFFYPEKSIPNRALRKFRPQSVGLTKDRIKLSGWSARKNSFLWFSRISLIFTVSNRKLLYEQIVFRAAADKLAHFAFDAAISTFLLYKMEGKGRKNFFQKISENSCKAISHML